jgi:hypothetical protein
MKQVIYIAITHDDLYDDVHTTMPIVPRIGEYISFWANEKQTYFVTCKIESIRYVTDYRIDQEDGCNLVVELYVTGDLPENVNQ